MIELESDLWLDQPDARARIDARVAHGEISDQDAARLHCFVENGYIIVPGAFDDAFCDAFDADIDTMWRERPADLAISPPGPELPISLRDYQGPPRPPGYRFPDLHGLSAAARDLYLRPSLFSIVELIFDQPAIAFQSLYFEYGSRQVLHRDSMFVPTTPAAHLVASWVALEDVGPDCGPLEYVPGSQHLPWFEFEPGNIMCGHEVPQTRRAAHRAWLAQMMQDRGLESTTFTCKRGDAFIWHGGLLHGGSALRDPSQTRRSFVVHYSTAANYHGRQASFRVAKNGAFKMVSRRTEKIIERPGARGLASPLADH